MRSAVEITREEGGGGERKADGEILVPAGRFN